MNSQSDITATKKKWNSGSNVLYVLQGNSKGLGQRGTYLYFGQLAAEKE